jgi:hypothetical protein
MSLHIISLLSLSPTLELLCCNHILDLLPKTVYMVRKYERNSRMFPIESLVHDSGRTLVCAEYGYPKGSPNTNS